MALDIFSLSAVCCVAAKEVVHHGKTQSQRGGKPPKTKGRLVEEQYTEGRPPETEKAICKNVLGRTQAEAKAKLKEAIEMERDINTVKSKKYAGGMDERVVRELCKRVRPSSHQTYRGCIDNCIVPNIGAIPLEKLTSLDLQKPLQEAADQRPDRQSGGQGTTKRPQRQDGAEHSPDSFLCLKAGSGAADHTHQPGGGLCPA